MKITIESTNRVVTVESEGAMMPARVWEGVTENGVKVVAVIVRVVCHKDDDAAEFERDLKVCRPPSGMAMDAIPLRLII